MGRAGRYGAHQALPPCLSVHPAISSTHAACKNTCRAEVSRIAGARPVHNPACLTLHAQPACRPPALLTSSCHCCWRLSDRTLTQDEPVITSPACQVHAAAQHARSRAAVSKWQWPHACECVSNLLKLPMIPITHPQRCTCWPFCHTHICPPHRTLSGSQCCCQSTCAHALGPARSAALSSTSGSISSAAALPVLGALLWPERWGTAGLHDQQSCSWKGWRGRKASILWAVVCLPTAIRTACEDPAAVIHCCSKRLPHCLLPPALLAATRLCCA